MMMCRLLIIMVLGLVSCHSNENITQTKEYPALVGAFRSSIYYSLSFTTSTSDTLYIYNQFANSTSSYVLEEIYTSFYDYLEYEINDSILQVMATRPDREFSNLLIPNDALPIPFKMISDTTGLSDYMYVSEPIDIDPHWLFFSITRLSGTTGEREHYVSYVEKLESGQINLAYLYDWQLDRLRKREVFRKPQ